MSPDARIFAEPELIRVDLQTPARHATPPIGAGAIATAGGPVQTTPRGGSPTAPARAVADSEGRAGDPPVSGAVPFLSPRPFPRPGLAWLPALMLPSLLLLAAIDYTAWAAWWI